VLAAWRGFRERTPWLTFLLAAIGFGTSIGLHHFLLPFSDATSLNLTRYIPTLTSLPRQLALLIAYLVLQFPGPALFLAAVGAWRAFERPWLGAGLGLIFLANVVVVLNHRVPDQYVFYIPAYVISALWVGLGTETAADWLC
jgi:hypothetical protein